MNQAQSWFAFALFLAFCCLALGDQPRKPSRAYSALPSSLQAAVDAIPQSARDFALGELGQYSIHDAAHMRVDQSGHIYIVEDAAPAVTRRSSGTESARLRRMFSGTPPTGYTSQGVPIHHSRPFSSNKLYLNFLGQTIIGTRWNTGYGQAAYYAMPYTLDGDSDTINAAEQTAMSLIWARVAEDYSPFNVDVTTEAPTVFTSITGTACITRTTDRFGTAMPDNSGGGVAYVGVFGDSNYQTYQPALVYYDRLARGQEDIVAEACSHELGHNLGLSHDGTAFGGLAYYAGSGTGDTSWAPIMGNAYRKSVTKFNNGDYPDANNQEDDLAIIASRLAYFPDDVGGNIATATALSVVNGAFSGTGIIGATGDVDVFAINVNSAGALSVTVNPYYSVADTRGDNLDVLLTLTNAANVAVASANPSTTTNAALTINAVPGLYYLQVSGTGSPSYSTYGSLGQYTVAGSLTYSACSTPSFITSAGTVISNINGGLLSYNNNQYCQWTIRSPGLGSVPTLTFTQFNTELNFDFVMIFDGSSTSAPLLLLSSGTYLFLPVVSATQQYLTVVFTSDYSVTAAGFQATVSFTNPITCLASNSLTAPGTIKTNEAQSTYNNNQQCTWTITAPAGSAPTLTFSAFSTESGYDFFTVYDGPVSGTQLLRASGSTVPAPITGSQSVMTVTFSSDSSVVFPGVVAQVSFTSPPNVCSFPTVITTTGTAINTNVGVGTYNNLQRCLWTINAPSGTVPKLTFSSFQTERGYDFFNVFDGKSTSSPRLLGTSGTTLPGPVTGTTEVMTVSFSSDISLAYAGVVGQVSFVPVTLCSVPSAVTQYSGNTLLKTNTNVGTYASLQSCVWTITSISGNSVPQLSFSAFSTESGYDFFTVYDGPSTSSPILLRTSGNALPGAVKGTQDVMTVTFTSDSSVVSTGVVASVAFVPAVLCSTPLTLTSPTQIGTNVGQPYYINNQRCQWSITAPVNTVPRLTISGFITERNYDFFRVFNGPSTSSPVLLATSGAVVPPPVTATQENMVVTFASDSSVVYSGVNATLSFITPPTCSLPSVITQAGTVISTNSQPLYTNNQACTWQIVAPVGQVSYLTITSFNTEVGFDFFKIYDGATTGSTLLSSNSGILRPFSRVASQRYMLVTFSSDISVAYAGVVATVRFTTLGFAPIAAAAASADADSSKTQPDGSAAGPPKAVPAAAVGPTDDSGVAGPPKRKAGVVAAAAQNAGAVPGPAKPQAAAAASAVDPGSIRGPPKAPAAAGGA